MIVEKIDNTDSWAVRVREYDRTYYLVREASTETPHVVSIRNGGYGPNSHVYLDSKGPTARKAIKAVRMSQSSAVRVAVDAWFTVSSRYADFGASDTEPRGEFAQVFEDAVAGNKVTLPRSIRQWQIFDRASMDGQPGSGDAAKALTAAAKKVVQAVRRNPAEGRAVFEYYYGYVPFGARS